MENLKINNSKIFTPLYRHFSVSREELFSVKSNQKLTIFYKYIPFPLSLSPQILEKIPVFLHRAISNIIVAIVEEKSKFPTPYSLPFEKKFSLSKFKSKNVCQTFYLL